ncbi:predicted protein [Sclerotinia sclerotiorum 1980 UF-70]|uniref:Uncharacterized protein n=1 Tax=Sclerotinia sclerotiorum (strain ATCC 18683 / 1980 / Ss-1) TaxID=665079 RepID=A7EJ19_SCLS1|nr:predicted protein [Sclerotinia sclerotiorum 1980 UF-70]EDO02835.1 predicted protein [Sclerotinia sclerotiorum 1980 UF-70]
MAKIDITIITPPLHNQTYRHTAQHEHYTANIWSAFASTAKSFLGFKRIIVSARCKHSEFIPDLALLLKSVEL